MSYSTVSFGKYIPTALMIRRDVIMESRYLQSESPNKEIQKKDRKRKEESISDRDEKLKKLRQEYREIARMTQETNRQEAAILTGVSSQGERTNKYKEAIS